MKKKYLLVIVGPTAIGKTDISIKIAKQLNTEIISCDSRQFYKELLIGSAPPSKKQLSTIKHHFIHNKSINEDYSAGIFENDAINTIQDIHKKNKSVIAVGGSGLYIDALCNGFNKIPIIPDNIRQKTIIKFEQNGLLWLQEEVKKIDPFFFNNCDKKNPRRLLRALETYYATGEKLSSLRTKTLKKRPFKIIKIGLEIKRDILYQKINLRVDQMIKNGLLDEVKSLIPFKNNNALNTVGYKEIFDFYNKKHTLEESIENIKKNTRRLAKRQITWFKKDQTIKWFHPNQINEINDFILKW